MVFLCPFSKLILPPWIGGRSVKNVEKSPNPKIHYVFWIVIPKIGINLGIRVIFLIA